jgi:hypothetical protein
MVASVLMVIMALITLGFTRIVQNEQRQAIDNQLSRQAFYAAESGVNIAASTPGFPGDEVKDDCDLSDYRDGEISAEEPEVVFTCLLINPTPPDLVFGNDSITTNKSKVVPIKPSSAPEQIIFEWSDSSRPYNSSNPGQYIESDCSSINNLDFDINDATWNKIGLLSLDLIAIPQTTFNRDSLIDSQFGAIFYPCDDDGLISVSYDSGRGADNLGKIIPVNCTNPGEYNCRIAIDGISAALGTPREFYARFNSIFSELNVRITALEVAGNTVRFSDSQAVVDSTGRAVDVYSRVQARVPLYDNFDIPQAALQTLNDVCKQYEVRVDSIIDNCN